MNYIFDVDGTLTPSRQKIDYKFEIFFKEEAEVEVNDPPPTSATNHQNFQENEEENDSMTEETELIENIKLIKKYIDGNDGMFFWNYNRNVAWFRTNDGYRFNDTNYLWV